ncbi:MAG: hypothetical protein KDE20_01100 [Caldilineaceae bacterium]|nr:hypothetical protein [Caldilineaceae bacterium]
MLIPTSSRNAAIALSRALFRLARTHDEAGDVARYYCGWLQHPTTEQWAINLPSMSLATSSDADPHGLDAIFQPFVDAGQMDASELVALQAAIAAHRGQRIVPVEFLALLPSFATQALTDAEAAAAGWFAEAGE